MSAVPYMSAPSIAVKTIAGQSVANRWAQFKPYVDEALEYEQECIEAVDVFRHLREGSWLCLVIYINDDLQGLCICEQKKARAGWHLDVLLLSGMNMSLWFDRLYEALRVVARSQHCSAITVKGRMGWLKILKRVGFVPISQHMRLEL